MSRLEAEQLGPEAPGLLQKVSTLNWGLIAIVVLIAAIGCATLYSAGQGSWDPWAMQQALRFTVGLALAIGIALIDIRLLLNSAYPVYAVTLALVVAVEFVGEIGKGAQRWIDLGVVQLQPSELMKVVMVMVLARHFHGMTRERIGRVVPLLLPLALVLVPVVLIFRQPDFGTAALILCGAGTMFFLAGVRLWKFLLVFVVMIGSVPLVWLTLEDYQKERIETFLDPGRDPLGAGYHITQSKIALGSGGLFGKGFLQGSQSRLNFLPEKQTDFAFTLYAEEFGLMGALFLLVLFSLVVAFACIIGMRAGSQFARLLALGAGVTVFLYVFVNVAMVTGLVPVVGAPLPLISYGGTAMITFMIAIGFMVSAHVHRDVPIGRQTGEGV